MCHAIDLPRVAANAPNPASTYIDRQAPRDKAKRIRRAKPVPSVWPDRGDGRALADLNAGHVKRGVPSMGHSVPLRKRPTDTRLWSDGHGASM